MNTLTKLITGLLVVTGMTSVAAADATQRIRHMEFSIAGSAQAFVDDHETSLMVNMPLRIGVFITRDFEIEAEGITTVTDGFYDAEVGYIASVNGSYNFPAGDRQMPFFLLGIGFTNSLPLGNVIAGNENDDRTLTVLNAGFGWKFLFTKMAALRIEYRFQRFSGERQRWQNHYDDYNYYSEWYTQEFSFNLHSMFLGVSLFF